MLDSSKPHDSQELKALASSGASDAAAPRYDDDLELQSEISRFLEDEDAPAGLAKPRDPINSSDKDGLSTYANEAGVFGGYMAPIFVNQLIWRYAGSLGPVTQFGQTGPLNLAGAALANTTFTLLCFVPAYATSSALDTLATQAHGGRVLGSVQDLNRLYCLKAMLVMCISMVFLIPLTCFFEPIFNLMGVEAEVSHIAARYMQCASIGFPGFYFYECLRKYCQAQGRNIGPAVAVAVAAAPTILLYNTQVFGLYTPPLALGFLFNLMFIVEVVYALYTFPPECFQNFPSWAIVSSDLGLVMKLSAAGLVSIGSDFFAWEGLSFASAWIGNTSLAANSVFLTSAHFFFSLPAALMQAAATRVGNHLGSNHPLDARRAATTSLVLGAAVASSSAVLVLVNAKNWSSNFTEDPEVTAIVQRIMPFFCLIAFGDAIQGVAGGVLRGAGMPIQIANAMALGHYAIGLPLAYLFAFAFKDGLFGLWLGFGVGLFLVCARLNYLVIYNDWRSCASAAQKHLQSSSERVMSS